MSETPPPFLSTLAHHSADPFRLLVESVVDYAIYLVDPLGRIASWNPGAERIYGYRSEEIIGQPFETVFDPADLTNGRPNELWQRALATGHHEFECNRARKDHSTFRALVTVSSLTNQFGTHAGFSVVTRDLTERKLAEDAVRRERDLSDAILSSLPGIYYIIDADRRFLRWNARLETASGYSAEEIRALDPVDLFHSSDRELIKSWMAAVFEEGGREIEAAFVAKDGRQSPYLFNGVRTQVAGQLCLLGMGIDLSSLVRTREELLKTATLLRAVIEATPDALFVKDRLGKYLLFNSTASRLVGRPAEEVLGRDDTLLFDPAGSRLVVAQDQRVMDTGQTNSEEVELTLAGVTRTFESTKVPFRDEEGNIVGVLGISRDVTERKQAEAEQRQLAERLRSTLESIREGFFILDDVWRFTYVNPEALRLVPLGGDELIGRTLWEAYPESMGIAVEQEYRRAREEGVSVEFEAYFPPLKQWFGVRAHPTDHGLAVYFRDVTSARMAEESLRESERHQRETAGALESERSRLVAAQAVAKVGSWETDLSTLNVVWSDETYRIFGKEPTEFHPTHPLFLDLVHPEDRDAVDRAFQDSLHLQGPQLIEHRIVMPDGLIKYVEERWEGTFDEHDKVVRVTGTCQDTTDRTRAEETMRLHERAIQAVAEGILITDPNQPGHPIIFVSGGFERMTGYRAEAVIGQNCRFLQGKDTDRSVVQEMRTAIAEGKSFAGELLNYRANGTSFWNQLTITPVLDSKGQLTHFVGVQTDVTERRRLEAQYQQSQKMEAVGRLAGGVAHDFNNMLTIISGYTELLLSMPELDTGARDGIVAIKEAGERAASLTRQLLGFSRQTVLQPRVLDLNSVIAETTKMLQRLIGEDVRVATVLDPTLSRVKVDPGQLDQLLVNLVVNARDAMPTGGDLTIETRNIQLSDDHAAVAMGCQPGPHVMLAISDTGTGMSPEVMQRMFEPFFTTKEIGKGTGLGLAVVFGIAQQSGGCIQAYSEPNRGSTFTVYLPAVSDPLSVRPAVEPSSESHGTETILLVEDEDAVRRLAIRILTMLGYQVLPATDGEDALRVVASHSGAIDLILTDVIMPNLGGPELVRELRASFPDSKVLFMSGYTDDAVVRHGLIDANMAFIEKPYTLKGLAQKVRAVLDER